VRIGRLNVIPYALLRTPPSSSSSHFQATFVEAIAGRVSLEVLSWLGPRECGTGLFIYKQNRAKGCTGVWMPSAHTRDESKVFVLMYRRLRRKSA
jgi:hypothetical protein